MGKKLLWLGANSGMLASCYYGLFRHVEWAGNIFLFMVWLELFINTAAAGNKEVKAKARAKGREVPEWLAIVVDIPQVLALAAVGWYFSAAAKVIAMIAEGAVYDGKN